MGSNTDKNNSWKEITAQPTFDVWQTIFHAWQSSRCLIRLFVDARALRAWVSGVGVTLLSSLCGGVVFCSQYLQLPDAKIGTMT